MNEINPHIKFKNTGLAYQFFELNTNLQMILNDAAYWCESRGLPFIITRMIDGRIIGVSKTDIHEKKRAADLSVKGWTRENVVEFCNYLNQKFAERLGAYPITGGSPRVAVDETQLPDIGPHLHIQVRLCS
jgi:hypothetical protein